MMRYLFSTLLIVASGIALNAQLPDAFNWNKYELIFTSSATYENPVQEVKTFEIIFTSPTGVTRKINGFWDGGTTWRARFMPDETGSSVRVTTCPTIRQYYLQNILLHVMAATKLSGYLAATGSIPVPMNSAGKLMEELFSMVRIWDLLHSIHAAFHG